MCELGGLLDMQTPWVPFLPPSASTLSDRVDALYLYLIGITGFFTLLIVAALLLFMVKYRRRSPYEIPRPIAGSRRLETIWTVIPFIIAMSFFVWGAQLYCEQSRPPENAIEVLRCRQAMDVEDPTHQVH